MSAIPNLQASNSLRSQRKSVEEDDDELQWAAIQRLPTYDRVRKGLLREVVQQDGKVVHKNIDLHKLRKQEKKVLVDAIHKAVEEDNEKFLGTLRNRINQVQIKLPNIEVRFEHLAIEGNACVGKRALPTLLNSVLNACEVFLGLLRVIPSKKRSFKILDDVTGIVKPCRMTLLLGPPGSGKTTLLQALAGGLDKTLKVTGEITYNGHELSEFIPQKSGAYISQNDTHYGEMTVRETLNFSGTCLGVGARRDMLEELSRREKEVGIMPDPDIDVFMKAISVSGQKTNIVTDYVLKLLGLDICADTMVGDDMRRGISGGQKKRVTTGEMLVGPAKVLLMDEISTGLDSSTTYKICKYMKQVVHILDATMIISLLQPAPETYELFDDIILLSEGKIVYQGLREDALEFFENLGFKCPERKGVADFLQEVTSKKDQEQYWFTDQPYNYISVSEFSQAFESFRDGVKLMSELRTPYDKSESHPAALVKKKYGISNLELLKVCFSREWLLMKRNYFFYVFKIFQITIMSLITMTVFFRTTMHHKTIEDGRKYLGALFFSLLQLMFNGSSELSLTVLSLPPFYKQRDFFFYPAWAYALPSWILRIPLSFLESFLWTILTYYTIGYAPSASRFFCQWLAFFCTHQMAVALFHFLGAIGRSMVVANTIGMFALLVIFLLGGFIIAKDDVGPWLKWAFYLSPMMYGQNAIAINEFLAERWSTPNTDQRIHEPTIGKVLLASRGFFQKQYWFWICIGALMGFTLLYNMLYIITLTCLNPLSDSKASVLDDDDDETQSSNDSTGKNTSPDKKGMILPFLPLSLTFNHINYYIDMPDQMKNQGFEGDRLQLLQDISGSFKPRVLTALVGVSGSGKTTLMDVLAGRKTVGYIEGDINISGYPKSQKTFARVSGYCEQNDIHSPHVTVHESLVYSALLRLPSDVETKTRKMFVEEIMELVELTPLKDAIVGLEGVDGLSTEQRKRLTIAVELVANPSIIFMDEPTSGLDARAAAIVMRTVRKTVDTGRTVVCTIHQPSIDIFEAFDELLLLKRGGQIIYAGSLGQNSRELIDYFQAIPGVPKIADGDNPATWMLEISTSQQESQLNLDFAEQYANSSLYKRNQDIIKEANTPPPGSNDLNFPTKYPRGYLVQFKACFWKQFWSYWRDPLYNVVRFVLTFVIGLMFGVIFWNKGGKVTKKQDLETLLGAMYSAVLFLGTSNGFSVQPVVAIERTVYYRERAAGMYSALPYAFAQVAIEAIYIVCQSSIYTLILYSMMGFEWKAGKFFYFYYFLTMCFLYFTFYGMMLVSLTPNHQYSAIMTNFFFSLWNLFAGFVIPRRQLPIWWRWYYWASPVAWTLYGTVTSQVGDYNNLLVVPGSKHNISVQVFLRDYLGYDYSFLPIVAVVHVGWALLFSIAFACGIKFINFQKR